MYEATVARTRIGVTQLMLDVSHTRDTRTRLAATLRESRVHDQSSVQPYSALGPAGCPVVQPSLSPQS